MERMWRKVNQGLSGRSSKSAAMQSSDTASSAGFGDPQIVVAVSGPCGTGGSIVAGNIALSTSTPTGRRLATSGHQTGHGATQSNSFSQHVISTASSERRRKRRRKSRPRRNGGSGGGGGGGSGGGYGGSERTFNGSRNDSSHTLNNVSGTPLLAGTTSIGAGTPPPPPPPPPPTVAPTTTTTTSGDPSLRQRAVAKLRMFNFHLNWDLHMTQCKPCGPRSSGNILTRRLCRNRRREDNELYRSNSFKFERFERKEGGELGADTLQKKIVIALIYVAMASADKLAGHYITAPSYAGTSGGNGNFLQSPHQSYLPPGQHFNQYGQPTSVHIGYGHPKPAYQQTYRPPQQPSYQQSYQPPQQPSYQHSYQPNRQHYGASLLKYESVNNGDGNYNFEYQTADGISRREEGHLRSSAGGQLENVVTGSYSYTGPDGHLYSVTYTADSTGFHPVGDHLPTPPPIPEAIKQSLSPHGQYQLPTGGYSSGRPAAQYIPPNKYIPPQQPQYSGYRGYY